MMNILFLTIGRMESIEQHSIYPDLLRALRNNGHKIYTISPYEKRVGKETELIEENGVHYLYVKIGNLTKCNVIEKGISTLLIEKQFKDAIGKYYSNVKFDLVLYSTPPITLCNAIEYVKKRDNAKTYLLLKDIFPQNAVDLGMLSKSGAKGILYKYFRNKEKKLYALSDRIGCMSQANVDYVIKHNPDVPPNKVEVCPNCIEPIDMSVSEEQRIAIRQKYGIPLDKKVFVYGGNLGKPQGIPFLINCLRAANDTGAYFLIVGDGTEYSKLEAFVNQEKPEHVKLMKRLPKEDYDAMVGSCDVGMLFLDHRFTIPNFPSRLLSYMQAKLPVLAVTDPNTDVGKVIVDGGFGWWCESNDVEGVKECIRNTVKYNLRNFGEASFEFLVKNYDSVSNAKILLKSIEKMI